VFDHILVAVDGSKKGGKTVPVAVDLATKYGSSVTVVHVREHGRFEGGEIDLGPAVSAEDLVDGVIGAFQAAGVSAAGVIRRVSPGDTPQQIVEVAKESHADLIVMGTRGMTEWKSLVLGGVANKVVHHSTCPVLLVR
jgi:nucleotide-binding universal stress UspA family protein